MKRPLLVILIVAVVAVVAAGAAAVWVTAARDREYERLIASGDSALASDQAFLAIEAFSGAIALRGDSMLAYLKRGETYRRHGDLNAAVRDLRMASELDPTATRPLEQLGDVHYAQQRYARAAERYAAFVRLDDRSPRLLYKLALARFQDGRPAAAILPLRQATRLNDNFGEAYYLLGLCLRAQQQTNEAVWALERAVRLAPSMTAAREALADLFDALHREPERVGQLDALAKLEPNRPDRVIALALAQADAGRIDLAVQTLGRAADRHPGDMAVYTALASIWLRAAEQRGDHAALSKALEATRTVMSHATPTTDDLLLHGRALLLAGETEAALRALRDATSRLPVEPVAFERLATAAERTGNVAEARDALIRYAALTDNEHEQATAAARIAELSWRLRDPAQAITWLARALERSPRDPLLLSRLAEAELARGDRDAARAVLARAVAAGVSTPTLRRVEQTLR